MDAASLEQASSRPSSGEALDVRLGAAEQEEGVGKPSSSVRPRTPGPNASRTALCLWLTGLGLPRRNRPTARMKTLLLTILSPSPRHSHEGISAPHTTRTSLPPLIAHTYTPLLCTGTVRRLGGLQGPSRPRVSSTDARSTRRERVAGGSTAGETYGSGIGDVFESDDESVQATLPGRAACSVRVVAACVPALWS